MMAPEDARREQLMIELQARDAWNQRDYVKAQALAEQAASSAAGSGDDISWWNATFLVSETLRKQGRMEESLDVAEELSAHRITGGSSALSARVATLVSFALQGTGDLVSAITAAREAISHAREEPDHRSIRLEAQNALIAALAESGMLEEAWQECLVLADLLSTEPGSQATGMGYWAIGNVAFLLKHVAEGVEYHQLAAKNLSPTNDLDLWARFNRASASLRLTAGVIEPETLECIERAELASSIVGGTDRDRLELSITRAQWLVLTGQFDTAVEQLTAVVAQQHRLALHVAAEARYLLGQALFERGTPADAVKHLEESERLFLRSGAEDRASTARDFIAGIGRSTSPPSDVNR
ncbi:tetratricopeptide repeat protein [Vibrio cholerae]|nr:tetratricopeptide repeat protein [Vibrio cholerae]